MNVAVEHIETRRPKGQIDIVNEPASDAAYDGNVSVRRYSGAIADRTRTPGLEADQVPSPEAARSAGQEPNLCSNGDVLKGDVCAGKARTGTAIGRCRCQHQITAGRIKVHTGDGGSPGNGRVVADIQITEVIEERKRRDGPFR